jgi:hypothetical protein
VGIGADVAKGVITSIITVIVVVATIALLLVLAIKFGWITSFVRWLVGL